MQNKTKTLKAKRMFENIYDILGNTDFQGEAQKEWTKFLKGKEIEWDGDKNIIKIGRDFKFQLVK